MSFNRRQNAFSISDMQNPTASTAKDKANIFSGIAHYHPPGGKSSIDFANGTGSSIQQHNPWQTSSMAANASTDLSYHLQLSRIGGTLPTAGRRTAGSSQPSTPALSQSGSVLSAQQFSTTPRSGSSAGSYLAGYGEFSQPNSRLTSPAVPYRQQQQPAYAADASSNQQYGSYGWYGGGAAAVPGVGSSNGTMPAGCGWQLNGASNAGSSSIIGSYSGAGSTVNQGKYSSLMQQLIAQQQQQQQQQIYLTSGIGSRNNSANIRPALDAMDACSRDGGVQYGAQQQDACWSPRTGAAAGGGGSCKYDAAGGSYSTSGSGYAVMQSSSMGQGYQAATSAAGSLGAAAVRTSNPGVFPALAVVGGSSLPKPVGGAAFISCKGAFGGKTIVQPPGGRSSFNIFGGA